MILTERQRAAVERTGQDVCVVAGPGSGKTRVLVERFQWLVRRNVSPLRILAITFTEKAAQEIKGRLVKHFEGAPDTRRQMERAYVSTLHAFCTRLLRENAVAAGLDPLFDILDERESRAMIRQCAAQALDELFQTRKAEFRSLLTAWRTNEPADDLIRVYESVRVGGHSIEQMLTAPAEGTVPVLIDAVIRLREAISRPTTDAQRRRLEAVKEWLGEANTLLEGVTPDEQIRIVGSLKIDNRGPKPPISDQIKEIREQLLPAALGELLLVRYGRHREVLAETMLRFHQLYVDRKINASRLDFSDLEERAIALLRGEPSIREKVRSNFEAVLMDELQDTNPLQWELMDLVRRDGHFFAVGDINQSIFGFRHAEPKVFRGYRERIESGGGEVDVLARNHRSRESILEIVERVTVSLDGIERNPLEAGREFAPAAHPTVEVIAAAGADNDKAAKLEARWIARRIRELEGTLVVTDKESAQATRPARFSDIAVLVRNSNAVDNLEDAFREFSVPFLMARGQTFFEELEITDLMAWLKILANPRDEIALATVLRSPFFGMTDETLLRLRLADSNLIDGVRKFDVAVTAGWNQEDVERLIRFRALLRELRALRDQWPPDRLLARAIDECGYEDGVLPRERANIDKFLHLIRTWHAQEPRPLPELLDMLEELRVNAAEPSAPANDTPNAVQVLTIHTSKGLEFPVVFVAAMHLGTRPDAPALLYSAETGLGMLWRNPVDGSKIADPAHLACAERIKQRESEEADRLLYVAMTRAEEHLVLSWADVQRPGSVWPKQVTGSLSELVRRVEEVPGDDFPAPEAAASRSVEALPQPVAEGQFDSTASVTALSQFQTCPRQYYLQRYLGWKPDAIPGGGFQFDGEEMTEQDDSGELAPTELGTAVHTILAGLPEPPEGWPDEAEALAARFAPSELGIRAARATRMEREFDFVFALGPTVLRGQIDLWFEEDGRSVLVDYKTDRFEASRAEHYGVQLRLYALAIEKLTGRLPDEAWLYFLRPDLAVRIELDEQGIAQAQDLVDSLREAQNTLNFPLNEGNHCFHCSYYHGLCPR
ncbi:MAG: UvrD-helicase domain-containing protein [Bryobacteraceae bacterium]